MLTEPWFGDEREHVCLVNKVRLRTGYCLERCSQEDHMFDVLSCFVVSFGIKQQHSITCFGSSFNNLRSKICYLWFRCMMKILVHIIITCGIFKLVLKGMVDSFIWCLTLSINKTYSRNILKHLFQHNIMKP